MATAASARGDPKSRIFMVEISSLEPLVAADIANMLGASLVFSSFSEQCNVMLVCTPKKIRASDLCHKIRDGGLPGWAKFFAITSSNTDIYRSDQYSPSLLDILISEEAKEGMTASEKKINDLQALNDEQFDSILGLQKREQELHLRLKNLRRKAGTLDIQRREAIPRPDNAAMEELQDRAKQAAALEKELAFAEDMFDRHMQDAETTLFRKEQEIDGLQTEVSELTEQLETATSAQFNNPRLRELEYDNVNKENEITRLSELKDTQENDMQELKDLLEEREFEIYVSEQTIDTKDTEIAELKTEIADLKKGMQDLAKKTDELQTTAALRTERTAQIQTYLDTISDYHTRTTEKARRNQDDFRSLLQTMDRRCEETSHDLHLQGNEMRDLSLCVLGGDFTDQQTYDNVLRVLRRIESKCVSASAENTTPARHKGRRARVLALTPESAKRRRLAGGDR